MFLSRNLLSEKLGSLLVSGMTDKPGFTVVEFPLSVNHHLLKIYSLKRFGRLKGGLWMAMLFSSLYSLLLLCFSVFLSSFFLQTIVSLLSQIFHLSWPANSIQGILLMCTHRCGYWKTAPEVKGQMYRVLLIYVNLLICFLGK